MEPKHPGSDAAVVEHNLVRHAGHYQYGTGGHDLERWVVKSPTRPTELASLGLPTDARYHTGHRIDGVQFWTFTAIRPMSPGVCGACVTDGQIRDLRAKLRSDIGRLAGTPEAWTAPLDKAIAECDLALSRGVGFVAGAALDDLQDRRRDARARCTEILNAREASDNQKRDREKRQRRMAEREEV